jgi:hypothetical protein
MRSPITRDFRCVFCDEGGGVAGQESVLKRLLSLFRTGDVTFRGHHIVESPRVPAETPRAAENLGDEREEQPVRQGWTR